MFFAGLVLCLDGHIPISFDFKLLDGQRKFDINPFSSISLVFLLLCSE